MTAELLFDQRARRPMELALLVAPIDRLLEAGVAPLRAAVLGRPERDVAGKQDCRVEEHEAVDLVRTRRDMLEGEPRAEGVAQPGAPPVSDRRAEAHEVVLDPPRRLARRVAVPEEVRREDPLRPGESLGETREVPAPCGDPVEADDLRRAVPAPAADVERPRNRRVAVGHAGGGVGAGRRSGRRVAHRGSDSGPRDACPRGSSDPRPCPPVRAPSRGARGPLESRYPPTDAPECAGFVPAVCPRPGGATPAVVSGAPAGAHVFSCSVSSECGTISVRRVPSSLTSDQITVPSRSMRKVPRIGAPVSSLNTP